MNPAWRFYKGPVEGAERNDFDDRSWRLVSLPDGMEYLPTEASGCINYQGEVWYRKHFTPNEAWRGRRQFLHFEAIMGKSKVWLNDVLLQSHYGGYLPVIVDITPYLKYGQDNVIAVWADNSDDPAYPPGKEQTMLDFAYFGCIHRDCWLVVHNPIFITDPNYEDEKASGGLFVSYDRVSELSAVVHIDTHIRNASNRIFRGKVVWQLYDRDDKLIFNLEKKLSLAAGKAHRVSGQAQVLQPRLWSPDSPYLYKLHVYVQDTNGKTVDGYYRRIGIRSIEFKGEDGFWLNGKPYPEPLIGANRHQDFAVIGNALSNSLHWRDAKKLRDAGLRVIRNAHYPQGPAFMDACDELGLFVIVNTPGWQFWNQEPVFAQRVYSDIRNMVRRDRNHPSVWLWEPILNETWYPDDFALNVVNILHEEYPYPYCYAGCDVTALGHQYFPVHFTHPLNGKGGAFNTDTLDPIRWTPKSAISHANGATTSTTGIRTIRPAGSTGPGARLPCSNRLKAMPKPTISIPATTCSTAIPGNMWGAACGTRSTTSGATIPTPSTGASWMPSDNPNCRTTCSVPSARPKSTPNCRPRRVPWSILPMP